MRNAAGLEHCLSFLNCQLKPSTRPLASGTHATTLRAITLSRQAGCGALVVAEKLAKILHDRLAEGSCLWTILDRNLMEKVLEDHHLPARLAKFLPEDRKTQIDDIMDDLFGISPPSWTVIQQTSETILRLAEIGGVILIGRGANVITARLPGVFHVRLVAPLEQRIEHSHRDYNNTTAAARDFVMREDMGRKRYLKKYFGADIDNPLLYHLIINTGLVSYDAAAELIADTALKQMEPAGVLN